MHYLPKQESHELGVDKGYTSYLGNRKLNYFLRICLYRFLFNAELEIKKNSIAIINNHLKKNDFFLFNKFVLGKFLDKVKQLAPHDFTFIYLDFCIKNKEKMIQVFQLEKDLVILNPTETLVTFCSTKKPLYTF